MMVALSMGIQEWSVLEDMSVSQLSGMLQQRGVPCVGCTEKEDYIAKLRELEVEDDMLPARPLGGGNMLLDVKYCMS